MKNYTVTFRIERTPGISPTQRTDVVQCINFNEAKELLARRYGVDKSHIALISMKPLQ